MLEYSINLIRTKISTKILHQLIKTDIKLRKGLNQSPLREFSLNPKANLSSSQFKSNRRSYSTKKKSQRRKAIITIPSFGKEIKLLRQQRGFKNKRIKDMKKTCEAKLLWIDYSIRKIQFS